MTTRLTVLLAIALTACSEHEPPPSPQGPSELRGPSGPEAPRCDGRSIDPAQDVVAAAMAEADREAGVRALEALAGGNRSSATVRVRLGELLLREPAQAQRADRWLELALELHDRGCVLADEDLWVALEGRAQCRFMLADYAGALPLLRRSIERFGGTSTTHYNLACALCRTGDVGGCATELERALGAASRPAPELLASRPQPPVLHFVGLAERDPDLEALRADRPRFEAILAPHR